MSDIKFIPASQVYKDYSLPRNLLRTLAENGKIECIEKETGGPHILKLYSVKDIKKYLNEK